MTISLNSRTTTRLLTALVILLLLGHLAGKISAIYLGHDMLFGLIPLFDLTEERNIATFYSALAILFAAALIAVAMVARRRSQSGDSTGPCSW